jgi:DNA-binding NarL/FixJ family response regulator
LIGALGGGSLAQTGGSQISDRRLIRVGIYIFISTHKKAVKVQYYWVLTAFCLSVILSIPSRRFENCDALANGYGLSKREREILEYLSRGYNSPYIAQALFISESTVRSHLRSIYRKMKVNSRMEVLDIIRREQ